MLLSLHYTYTISYQKIKQEQTVENKEKKTKIYTTGQNLAAHTFKKKRSNFITNSAIATYKYLTEFCAHRCYSLAKFTDIRFATRLVTEIFCIFPFSMYNNCRFGKKISLLEAENGYGF